MNKPILLEHEQTMCLINSAQKGDREAQQTLVEHNVPLVKSIVKKFLGRGVHYDDLFQIGCIGLVKGIANFNADFNVKFSTYAVPMIAGEIKRFLRDDGMVKVSRSLKEIAAKATFAQEKLKLKNAKEPSINEISKEIGVEVEEIIMALDASKGCISLEEPIFENEGASLLDVFCKPQNETDALINNILIKDLLGKLAPQERQIIFLRYFQDQTQSEIAKKLCVSQVQVSRMETRIIAKMQKACALD